ncbi:splicing factor 1-like [Rattus rattus]|uniref:splicing factor 1-like n=1 Tax=Rattus rattus TaxID=10117 RepID=UPI0013F36990|nr:splicing factor 1-like [Rattus rattus]
MNHPPFPPPGLFSSLLRPRPPWAASGPEQHRPGVGAARWSRSRRPCAVVRAPGGRGQWGSGRPVSTPGIRERSGSGARPGPSTERPPPEALQARPGPLHPHRAPGGLQKGRGVAEPRPGPHDPPPPAPSTKRRPARPRRRPRSLRRARGQFP